MANETCDLIYSLDNVIFYAKKYKLDIFYLKDWQYKWHVPYSGYKFHLIGQVSNSIKVLDDKTQMVKLKLVYEFAIKSKQKYYTVMKFKQIAVVDQHATNL